jgi:hypothetical protein
MPGFRLTCESKAVVGLPTALYDPNAESPQRFTKLLAHTGGSERNAPRLWKMVHAWEKRLFLPLAPIANHDYYENVLRKGTYATTAGPW